MTESNRIRISLFIRKTNLSKSVSRKVMGKLEIDTYFYSIIFLINVQFELKILLGEEATTRRVLSKKVFGKLRKIYRKTPVPESLFLFYFFLNLLKGTLAQVFSCKFYEVFKNTFFTEQLWMTASVGIFFLSFFEKQYNLMKLRLTFTFKEL